MRMYLFPVAAALLCSAALPAVTVDNSYYHEDVGRKYAWTEGAPGITDFAATDRRAGLLIVTVRNDGPAAVPVQAHALNGQPLQALRDNEKHEVIWWRTFPNPVPAKGLAEISVRLRYPLMADATLTLQAGAQQLQAKVPATPPPFRIETVSWRDGGKIVWLVARQMADKPGKIVKVLLDGQDVTKQASIPAPGFAHGLCPIEMRASQPLAKGSFHTYKLVSDGGQAVACTLRTLDEFMQLGLYGPADLDQAVKTGLNAVTHFGAQDQASLDRFLSYGMRNGFYVRGRPDPRVVKHPATYAYYLHDEPDCWDYSSGDWPHPLRIGYRAPDCIRDMDECLAADPVTPVSITLDLTYKPANYYVYAPIPDIVTPDCYPLTIGQPLTWVRGVTETCRFAAGPRRVDIVPQVDFEDRSKANMKFRRPPFDREVIIQYLYALGAGARGFSGWEWFDEKSNFAVFHGAPNYPDVMHALTETFARFKLLEPLILQAHPAEIATCDNPKVWVRTLVCGLDALLVVLVNDDYECLAEDFKINAQENVRLRVPALSWMKAGYVARAVTRGFAVLQSEAQRDGCVITLPQLRTGEVLVVAKDGAVAQTLGDRYTEHMRHGGARLIEGHRYDLARQARNESQMRHIMGRYKAYLHDASKSLNAYGTEHGGFFNPTNTKYPGLEWWTEATPRGGEWQIAIPAEHAGQKHTIFFQTQSWWNGGHLRVEVAGPDGKQVLAEDRQDPPQFMERAEFTPATAGEYTIRLLHAGESKPGGRMGRFIYVVPEAAGPLPGAAW
ncbi:MAG: hypothetical protein KKI08_24785 [Armatimonadetes bacterium]|nr:hypothetical protein [Armatimonadota bacterium]